THLPRYDLSLTGLPPGSTATSSSASRSPTLSTSAEAGGETAVATAKAEPKTARDAARMAVGRIEGLSIHGQLFVDPHLDVLGVHRAFVLAVVEKHGGRRVHTGLLALLEIGGDLGRGSIVGPLEPRHVEADRLGVPHHVVTAVARSLVEQL